jgi:hypothetical protein
MSQGIPDRFRQKVLDFSKSFHTNGLRCVYLRKKKLGGKIGMQKADVQGYRAAKDVNSRFCTGGQ